MHPSKVHWTQRPENKEKLKEMAQRSAVTREKNKMNGLSSKKSGWYKMTPEERSIEQKRRIALRKVKKVLARHHTISTSISENPDSASEAQIAYIFGRIEAEAEAYARSIGVSQASVTTRLGQLLLIKGRR